jgi:hypothetical protein
MAAMADLHLAQAKTKNAVASAIAAMASSIAAANADSEAAAMKARAKVTSVDQAHAAQQAAEAQQEGADSAPPDITQFFPPTAVGGQPGGAPPRSFMELMGGAGGSANALANRAVAPARQAAGTLPSGQPQAPQQMAQAGGGQSVNVGGQTFSAPDTMTTTRETTGPLQFDPGMFVNATTREVVTEPNVLRAGDILAAAQQKQRNLNETLFRLGQEGVIGPDAVTAATALDRGDYATWGRVIGAKPMLSEQVQRKRMEVQDASIQAYRAQAAQSYEATRGNRLLNDMFAKQFTATAEGAGELSDNDIFGIPAPTPQSLGIPTSIRGALGGGMGRSGGGLTANQVVDTMRSMKVDKSGQLDSGSASALMALQGWGVQNRIAVFAAPKRGRASDLMRSFGIGDTEVSNVQMVPMGEVLSTVLKAAQHDPAAVARVTTEWGLFESDGAGSINTLASGPNAMLSQGLERKLQFFLDARGYGGDPKVAPPEVPNEPVVAPAAPTPTGVPRTAEQQKADRAVLGIGAGARAAKERVKGAVRGVLTQPAPLIPTQSPEEAAFGQRR